MQAPDPEVLPHGVSVVVPVFNSAETLAELTKRLLAVLTPLTARFEIILVNDGSQDEGWQVITNLTTQDPNIAGINLMRNYGQHNALLAGIRQARYQVTVTLDDDLQNPPEEVPKLINRLAEGADVVYGTPQEEQHGLLRNLASQVTWLALQSTMGAETARRASSFRAFRTQLRAAFAGYHAPFVSIDVLLTWGTNRFAAIPVRHEQRRTGKSGYTFRMLIVHALNMITGFSTWPLQLASLVGFGFTLFGLGVLVFVIGRFLLADTSVPGFAFLASVIAIFAGAQLFALGIMGEYLARMHFRTMGRPASVVRETVGFASRRSEEE